jgi:hypothetical protein
MNVVLNGDNQVEALRPVALPPTLSGDSCSILLRVKRVNVASGWLTGETKKGKKPGGFPGFDP